MSNDDQPIHDQQALERERLYQHLITVQTGNSNGNEDVPQETLERIWSERALELARIPEEDQQGEQIEVLLVRMGREILGIDVHAVAEIRQNVPVTRVPRTPSWVLGVTNLRGRILSVVDLRAFLGLPEKGTSQSEDGSTLASLVEIETPEMEIVFLVKEVMGVEALRVEEIYSETGLIHSLPAGYVRGVVHRQSSQTGQKGKQAKNGKRVNGQAGTKAGRATRPQDGETILILQLEAVLKDPRLIINE